MSVPAWRFPGLRPFKYGALLIDPPWPFELYSERGGLAKSAHAHYRSMPAAEIQALPIDELAAGDCLLWMWATWPQLPLAVRTMRAWGFKYVTGGSWSKRTKNGKRAFNTGYIQRNCCDPYLIGTIGDPPYVKRVAARLRNEIEAVQREHSRKPDEVYDILDRLLPHAFKAELFGRQQWPGWDAWGDEIGKFQPAVRQP